MKASEKSCKLKPEYLVAMSTDFEDSRHVIKTAGRPHDVTTAILTMWLSVRWPS